MKIKDSGKINSRKKVSLYTGNKPVGSEIIKKKGDKLLCYTVVKAVKHRKCTKEEKEAKIKRINAKYYGIKV